MERTQLESAAANYAHLRGLFGIPLGLVAILSALGNWEWGPLRHAWVFLAGVVVLGLACLLINRYYEENFGRITLPARQQRRAAVALVVSGPLVFGASLLLRSRTSWSLDLPVNATAASLGLLMLVLYAAGGVLRTHHVVIFGSMLVAGLLPVWNGADPSNIGLFLFGAAVVATGILDHRLLVRSVGPPNALELENSNAGA
jgi:hypothetical protein